LRVERARERLRDARLGEGQALRDPVEAVDPEHLVRDDRVLGEPALEVVAHRDLVRADVHLPAGAEAALAARDRRDDLHAVARGPAARDLGADLDDLARELVPHDARRVDVVVAELGDLHVRAAGGAGADADLHLPGAGGRLGRVLESDVAGRVEPQDSHRSPRSAGAAPSSGPVGSSSGAGVSMASTRSGVVASRSAAARSGSSRIWASSARMSRCPSPTAAMPMQTVTVSPSQSTPSGKRRKQSASRRTAALPARVACGMATPSPMYVDTDSSRSSMAGTYSGATAPVATSTSPQARMASAFPAARSCRR